MHLGGCVFGMERGSLMKPGQMLLFKVNINAHALVALA